jgi:two-component system response regulator YesN
MKTMVIIDDELWTREVIKKLVSWSTLGLKLVGEATDGETGFELIKKVHPDIVITDVRMPRLNGISLVKKLRREGFDHPVIMISGYDDYVYVREALKLGVTDYLLKPIRQEELNEQIQRCLTQRQDVPKAPLFTTLKADLFADKWWQTTYNNVEKKLTTALLVGDYSLVKEHFNHILETLSSDSENRPSSEVLIGVYYALLITLQKYIQSVDLSQEDAFLDQNVSFVFGSDTTPNDILRYMCDLYIAVMEQKKRVHLKKTRLNIDAVCRFLDENDLRSVTLQRVADVFHVSKEYLSKSFKADRKVSFTHYITSLKMKKAYKLITEYNVPLKDIAPMVGYKNQSHFYKTFKKYYGKTPGDIQKIKKRQ